MNGNALAALFVSTYLLVVIFKGRGDQLLNELRQESGFVRWFMALTILMVLKKSGNLGEIGDTLIAITFVAMLIVAAQSGGLQTATKQINQLFGVK